MGTICSRVNKFSGANPGLQNKHPPPRCCLENSRLQNPSSGWIAQHPCWAFYTLLRAQGWRPKFPGVGTCSHRTLGTVRPGCGQRWVGGAEGCCWLAGQGRTGQGRALESRVTRSTRPGIIERGQARMVEAEVGRLLGAEGRPRGLPLHSHAQQLPENTSSSPSPSRSSLESLLRPAFPTKHGSNSLGRKVSLQKARQEFN